MLVLQPFTVSLVNELGLYLLFSLILNLPMQIMIPSGLLQSVSNGHSATAAVRAG